MGDPVPQSLHKLSCQRGHQRRHHSTEERRIRGEVELPVERDMPNGTIFYLGCSMKEEIYVSGKKVLILIEPHVLEGEPGGQPAEYFTASYAAEDPPASPGSILFLEEDNTPKRFESPVQALEFASEKLLGLI